MTASAAIGPFDDFYLGADEMTSIGLENQGEFDTRLHHIRRAFRDAQRRRIDERDSDIFIIAVKKFPEREDIKGCVLRYASPQEAMERTTGRIR